MKNQVVRDVFVCVESLRHIHETHYFSTRGIKNAASSVLMAISLEKVVAFGCRQVVLKVDTKISKDLQCNMYYYSMN